MGDEVGNNLATDLWVKSVISALNAATTLVDVKNELGAYNAQADGWLKDVVEMLGKSGGDLDAFEYMLGRGGRLENPASRVAAEESGNAKIDATGHNGT
jgi:hypothetical protein